MIKTNIYLNSKDRDSGSNENYKYVLDAPIKRVKSIKFNSFTIPISYYAINSNNNDLRWTDGNAVSHTSTITSKDYNATQLATELQTVLNNDKDAGDTNTYSVSYNDQTLKYTIALSAGSSNFSLLWSNSLTTIAEVLGFSTSADDTGSTSYTSDNVISIGTDYFYVCSRNLSGFTGRNILNGSQPRNVIQKIPITVGFSALQTWKNDDNSEHIYSDNFNLKEIDLQLLDDTYQEIDLNGSNWAVDMSVYY